MPSRPPLLDDPDELTGLVQRGASVAQIAVRAGATERSVRRALRSLGVQTPREHRLCVVEARLADRRWLRWQAVEERRSPSEIAGDLGVPTYRVTDALTRFGLT